MAIYDVSVPIRPGMPTYPGEPGPEITYFKRIGENSSANVSKVSFGSHSGTHIDAPYHFLAGGAKVDELPVDALVGPAYVAEFGGTEHITAADLERAAIPADARRLLAKTQNGRRWEDDHFHEDFIAFASDAGAWLVDRGLVLVGIDYLSIERFRSPGHEVHLALLEAGVIIVEGLDLRAVSPGSYTMACGPLKMAGAEGAPARVFLWDQPPS